MPYTALLFENRRKTLLFVFGLVQKTGNPRPPSHMVVRARGGVFCHVHVRCIRANKGYSGSQSPTPRVNNACTEWVE